ncbi:glycosyltransferase family 2 protein [Chryseobacterium gotjawalense]|uniref:Glycosyltransferase family 2 protein n=1 Tax=Chryseobacterium gotjawalense TaxID=3042315 RepID=A0ABY8RI48_9FLAO|nr:glycosyltransferase family 2 protein [Chryseobacterium sp. wdc7]WHF53052.1 glycosyltransferase family 2 protein [Chryseobacterium sp. wdc7]
MTNISIVLYNTNTEELTKLIKSFTDYEESFNKIYVVDNSKKNTLEVFFKSFDFIKYIHNPSNPGFGAAHNLAIQKSIEDNAKYHFVVNPDIHFSEDVIGPMVAYMENNPDVGMMMPQILNEDGTVQNLPKLLPSLYSVLMRKFKKPSFIYNDFIEKYELRFVDNDMIYNAPILSGCFTLLNLGAVKKIGPYDDKFFMYFEDWDLSRRMHQKYKTIYFPNVSVYHGYHSGANRNKRLFKIFLNSAQTYFNKWGWFFDEERTKFNKETLNQFKK